MFSSIGTSYMTGMHLLFYFKNVWCATRLLSQSFLFIIDQYLCVLVVRLDIFEVYTHSTKTFQAECSISLI